MMRWMARRWSSSALPDAKDDDVDAVSKIVGQAGGAVTGTVSLTQEFVDANSAEKLRSVVNSSILPAGAQLSTKLVDQGSQAGDLLGIALLINPNPAVPPVDDAQRDTVLAALRDTGFITYSHRAHRRGERRDRRHRRRAAQDAGNQGVSVARFAAALAPHGSGTLLAGRDGSATGGAAVAVTRADAGMAPAISTVDDVDAEPGRITAILGMHDLINGGHAGAIRHRTRSTVDSQSRSRAAGHARACSPTRSRAWMLGWVSVGRQAQLVNASQS